MTVQLWLLLSRLPAWVLRPLVGHGVLLCSCFTCNHVGVAMQEVVKAARSLYPGLCGQAPTDLPPHGRTQAPYSKPVQDMQVVPQVPQSEPVKDMQEDPPLLVMPAVEQGAVSSYGVHPSSLRQDTLAVT